MIIAIEGADGCGKTSVSAAVAERIGAEVIPFPNDNTYTGKMIRDYLRKAWCVEPLQIDLDGQDDELSALAFQALNIANRMELMPHLAMLDYAGHNAVLARYWQSAWVYGQLDGLPRDWLLKTHSTMVQPDLNILLDVSAETCMARRASRDGNLPPERYEGKLERTKRIVELYRELWSDRTNCGPGDCVWVDATQDFDSVVKDILKAVDDAY
jgi:thymidylate kinase